MALLGVDGARGQWVQDPDLAIQLSEAEGWVCDGRDKTCRQGYSFPSIGDKCLAFRQQPCCSLPSRVLCFQPCEKSIQLALAASLISSSQFPNKLLVNIIEA